MAWASCLLGIWRHRVDEGMEALAGVVILALMAGSYVTVVSAPVASACIVDADGDCYLHVTGKVTATAGLNVRAAPCGTVLDPVPYNYSNSVDCYVQASDGSYWDWLYDSRIGRPGRVYDPYLYTGGNIYQQVDQMNEGNCGTVPLAMPANLRAVAAGSGHIHVSWTDTNLGSANCVVSNGNVSLADLAAGSTSYDWRGLAPNTYMCFAVAAKSNGQQSPWVEWACASTWPLSGPANVRVSVVSSYSINVTWTDPNGGDATYHVYDGASTFTVNPPNNGTTITGYLPNQYKCFAVQAAQSGQQTGWTSYSCATTSSCPSVEPTHPTCSNVGAFQEAVAHDHNTISPPTQNDQTIYSNMRLLQIAEAGPFADGSQFLGHYLDGTCSDLNYDSTNAFWNDSGFEAAIIKMFQIRVGMLGPSDTTFDSGWISFPVLNPNTYNQPDLGDWATEDWKLAVGHSFFRIVGTKQADGTWMVHLQLTSYYQFRDGVNFAIPLTPVVVAKGSDMHRLSQVGLGCPFRSIGNGNIRFIIYSDGSVRPGPA